MILAQKKMRFASILSPKSLIESPKSLIELSHDIIPKILDLIPKILDRTPPSRSTVDVHWHEVNWREVKVTHRYS